MKKRVVDLFTGVGGAYRGYEDAGLEVVAAIDIEPQPDHPNPSVFHQTDALKFLRDWIDGRHRINADLVHASMPCQNQAAITLGTNKHLQHRYPRLYSPVKALLEELGIPFVIENPEARSDMVLCGEMFGLRVQRHRRIELGGWTAPRPLHKPHRGLTLGMRHGKLVTEETGGYYYAVYGDGGYKGTVAQWQGAMGIHWTDNRKSIAEAIPPAYTELIGRAFLTFA